MYEAGRTVAKDLNGCPKRRKATLTGETLERSWTPPRPIRQMLELRPVSA